MYILRKIAEWLKSIPRRIDRRVILPIMQWIIRFFSVRVERRVEGAVDALPDWKQDALRDFRLWLEDLPDQPGGPDESPIEACDLYSILSEMTSLRQEIRMQNREQNRSLHHLGAIIEAYHDAADLFKEKSREIEGLADRVRSNTEKRTAQPFLEIRDALLRGLAAGREVAGSKSFLRSAPKGIDGVVDGYEMAIRRFDRALNLVGITSLETVGRPFDARTMKAVGTKADPNAESGTVVEEQLSGFVRGEEVVRVAEVFVAQ